MRSIRRPPPIPYLPDDADELDAKGTTPSNVPLELLVVKVPPSSGVQITARVVARNPVNGNVDAFTFVGTFKRVAAGNVVPVGIPAVVSQQQDDGATAATIAPSVPDLTSAAIVVTGLVGVPHNWNVNVRVIPVL
jgi:hypothetical protein